MIAWEIKKCQAWEIKRHDLILLPTELKGVNGISYTPNRKTKHFPFFEYVTLEFANGEAMVVPGNSNLEVLYDRFNRKAPLPCL